jgi:hypothetical protein
VDTNITDWPGDLYLHERTRLWLERAKGTLLYIHFRAGPGPATERDDVAEIKDLLRPHISSMSSLVVPVGMDTPIYDGVSELCAAYDTPGPLTTLRFGGNWDYATDLSWSTKLFQGLVDFQLMNLRSSTCPTLQNLITVLSSSPSLHTLCFVGLVAFPEKYHGCTLPCISLPNLRLLDLSNSWESLAIELLSMLSPGTLGLDYLAQQGFSTAKNVGSP